MNQDDVAGKILVELTELGIATDDNEWILYNYLSQAYAAGWDTCRHDYRAKRQPVIQRSLNGEIIKIHDSIRDAAREMEVNVASIGKALRGKLQTVRGYKWEYVNKPISSEAETIGRLKSKSTPPKPGSHVSKTNSDPA